jgi:hypothetical protein
VRLAAWDAGVTTGRGTSTPTSDQVPEETNSEPGSAKGVATTALAVSCAAGAITRVPASGPAPSSPVTGPRSVPGGTTSGSRRVGMPSASASSVTQRPVAVSNRPLVEAAVNSVTRAPESTEWTTSGSISSVAARSSRVVVRTSDISAKTVLISFSWTPVAR